MKKITIATRESPLALKQAEMIQQALLTLYPDLNIELKGFTTQGDRFLGQPLATVGGKGLFVKELEEAMLRGEADLAVHSMKDMPVEIPSGLTLAAICKRHDPRDAFVSNKYQSLEDLPLNASVGTSSLRRQCQIQALRPDLRLSSLRGNVNTRLRKLDEGEFDAIILAVAGLERLGLDRRIVKKFEPEQILPAAGQGALGLECRSDDQVLLDMLTPLADKPTQLCVFAERALNLHLNGGCQVPIASYAALQHNQLYLRGLVGRPNGSLILRTEIKGHAEDAQELGQQAAQDLLRQGANAILKDVYAGTSYPH